jgi:hypothetical protein
MLALRPGIQVQQTAFGQLLGPRSAAKERTSTGAASTEDWLRCIKDFGTYLNKVEVLLGVEQRLKSKAEETSNKTVKVALLDIGVDLLADGIRGRIRSDTTYFEGDTRVGTHIATAILTVYPQIELHFFKVDIDPTQERLAIRPDSIARVSITPHLSVIFSRPLSRQDWYDQLPY